MFGLFFLFCLNSFSVAENKLENIDFSVMPGNTMQVKIDFTESAPNPTVFTTSVPARIVLDFKDTSLKLKQKKIFIDTDAVRHIVAANAQGNSRLVVYLTSLTDYKIRTEGSSLYLILKKMIKTAGKYTPKQTITNIDFRRGEKGGGKVIFSFDSKIDNASFRNEGEKVIVNMNNVILPSKLERKLDVIDFVTPIKTIDTYKSMDDVGNKIVRTDVTIKKNVDFDSFSYQIDNKFIIEIKELTEKQKKEKIKSEFGYSGERLSLIFQDIEVRAVLQLIADFTGSNIIVSDTVSGNITLRLKNVPWDQALDLVLKTKGLAMRKEGNVIRVGNAIELAEVEEAELKAQNTIRRLEPIKREYIRIYYREATKIRDLLLNAASPKGEFKLKGPTKILVDNGNELNESDEKSDELILDAKSITADEGTNTLIIRDTIRNIEEVRALVKYFDVPIQQVLIDSRIVAAQDDFTRSIGLNWHAFNKNKFHNPTGIYTGNDAAVNLGSPANLGRLGISTAILGGGWLVDLELTAAESSGIAEIISSPRVVVSNGGNGSIEFGKEVPYQTRSDESVNIAFKDVLLKLNVTAIVMTNGNVKMKLDISNDSISGEAVDQTPILDKQSLKTEIIVKNGDTVVLGGVFLSSNLDDVDKVPLLGDIPVIGKLFSKSSIRNRKSELLIFITPKVMDSNLSVNN